MKVTKCDLCEEEIPAHQTMLTYRLLFDRGTGASYRRAFEKEYMPGQEIRNLTSVVNYLELCGECGATITTALQVIRNDRRKARRPIYVGPVPPPEGEGI